MALMKFINDGGHGVQGAVSHVLIQFQTLILPAKVHTHSNEFILAVFVANLG